MRKFAALGRTDRHIETAAALAGEALRQAVQVVGMDRPGQSPVGQGA